MSRGIGTAPVEKLWTPRGWEHGIHRHPHGDQGGWKGSSRCFHWTSNHAGTALFAHTLARRRSCGFPQPPAPGGKQRTKWVACCARWRYAFLMKEQAARRALVTLAALFALGSGWAADPKPADPAPEEKPKLYTTADLERMFGPSAPSEPKKADPEQATRDQKFVEAFLERQHQQIQADQQQAMQRLAMEQVAQPPAEDSYTMGYAPYYGWWGGDRQGGGHGSGNHGRPKPTPYFSPYAPKPGQPGWNEMVQSRAPGGKAAGKGGSGSQPKAQPHGHGGRR